MIDKRKVTAIILVAGNSTRYGQNRNKNFEKVNNKSIMEYSLEKLKKNVTTGALWVSCAISVYHTNGAPAHGAPLLYSSGAPHVWCAISVHIIDSPFPSSVVR